MKMKRTGRNREQYRAISNTVRDLTRRDHRQHVERITANLGSNPKPFWKCLKNNRSQLNTIPELTFKGEKFTSDVQKAEALNMCFKSAFTSEDTLGLEKLKLGLTGIRSTDSIAELTITEEEVYDELCTIDSSKACGPDLIPGRLLKEGAASLAAPLRLLFVRSLEMGTLPRDWRQANITPIHK